MYPAVLAEEHPDRAALVMGGSGEVVTYAELDQRSNQLAHLLRDAGLGRGDHIALLLDNHPFFFDVVWAALRSGLYLTAVNSHLSADEVAYIVEDCEAKAFVSSAALADVATSIDWTALPAVGTRLMIDGNGAAAGPGSGAGFDDYADALAAFATTPIGDESKGATMLYSSGTTGRPKGVLRPLPEGHPSEGREALAALRGPYNFNPEMVYLSPAPMYHAAPLGFSTSVQRFGGTVVMMERFDAASSLRLIESHRVTHSQWVPTMFVRMVRLPDDERLGPDLSSHEVAIHAAAPCPVEVKRRMIEWWGPIIYEYYAGTEGNGSTAIDSAEWLAHPGSVGRVRGVTKIHILDDDGNEVPAGEAGTIYFSGAGEFSYHRDPAKTEETRRPGGLSTLGDVGYLDGDGWLYLTDRKAFMIISGGVNIYPREVEDVLIQHDAVADVAVFGVPNDDLGEEVKAVVELLPGRDASPELAGELIAFTRGHLASFKCPRSVDFIDQLPRLATGKLYKRPLRDPYWA